MLKPPQIVARLTPLLGRAVTLAGVMLLLAASDDPAMANDGTSDQLDDPPPTVQRIQDLYVSSRNTNSVKLYNGATGAYLGNFVAPGTGGLLAPQEVAFGYDGHLLVSARGNNAILKFDGATGEYLGPFTTGYPLDEPTKMTFGPDSMLYVSQWGRFKGNVVRFNGRTGEYGDLATSSRLDRGMAHAWDASGTMYLASFGTQDIRRFAPDGTDLGVFISGGDLTGAVNLWFGADSNLFVVDWTYGGIRRYDGATGSSLGVFVSGMARSEGFAFGPDSLLYVCDWQNNQIRRYNATTGVAVNIFATEGGLLQPNSLVFGPVRDD